METIQMSDAYNTAHPLVLSWVLTAVRDYEYYSDSVFSKFHLIDNRSNDAQKKHRKCCKGHMWTQTGDAAVS